MESPWLFSHFLLSECFYPISPHPRFPSKTTHFSLLLSLPSAQHKSRLQFDNKTEVDFSSQKLSHQWKNGLLSSSLCSLEPQECEGERNKLQQRLVGLRWAKGFRCVQKQVSITFQQLCTDADVCGFQTLWAKHQPGRGERWALPGSPSASYSPLDSLDPFLLSQDCLSHPSILLTLFCSNYYFGTKIKQSVFVIFALSFSPLVRKLVPAHIHTCARLPWDTA